jgi:undecaprenyl-diphosphatase
LAGVADADASLHKSFEVALHGAHALGLLVVARQELVSQLTDRDHLVFTGLISASPAGVGYLFERPIEERLSTSKLMAITLALGGMAMVLGDLAPTRRAIDERKWSDALWLGAAQTCALIPGVSRSGAILTGARLLQFNRQAAWTLAAQSALPIIGGASALKAWRLLRHPPQVNFACAFAVGAAASFVSTLICTTLLKRSLPRRLAPYALYRLALASTVALIGGQRSRSQNAKLND